MSLRTLIIGNKLILTPFTNGDFGHAIPRGTTNNTDKERTFEALNLEPNDNRSGHWAYNIALKRRNSVPRFKGLSMSESVVKSMNWQEIDKGMLEVITFGDRNKL